MFRPADAWRWTHLVAPRPHPAASPSEFALGGDPAHSALVFLHPLGRRRGLRLACDDNCRATEPRDASIFLLLGAQVVAEDERLQDGDTTAPGELKTEVDRAELR